jgi:hypothetical protein
VSDPGWWLKAKALEQDGKLTEAEQTIRDAVPHLGSASQTAQLYLERMLRLQDAGDAAGAAEAYQKSSDWIYNYASWATSGGEGAALSWERDQFLKELNSNYKGTR